MPYGEKLKGCRKKARLTEEEAAKLIGISPDTLSLYENDKLKIPVSVFIKLARLYDFDVIDVLGVRCGNDIEADIPMFSLVAEHCAYLIKHDFEHDLRFGNIVDRMSEYHERYMDMIQAFAENPGYRLCYPGYDEVDLKRYSPFFDEHAEDEEDE